MRELDVDQRKREILELIKSDYLISALVAVGLYHLLYHVTTLVTLISISSTVTVRWYNLQLIRDSNLF